jgi:exodeoxyribonuclease III
LLVGCGIQIMKIATFNANSVRTRLGIIVDWVKAEQPDVLCIQETKAQDKDFPVDSFSEMGYQVVFRGQKAYNGVAIASKHPLHDVHLSLPGKDDGQARFISATVMGVHIVNAYVPQGVKPGTDKFLYKLQWLADLLSYFETNYNPDNTIALTGDFNVALENIDVHDPDGLRGEVGFHPDEQAMLKKLIGWGFSDMFRLHHKEGGSYTFWDYRIPNGFKRNMGWRIDYIFATRPLAQKCVDCHIDKKPRAAEKPSDHTFLMAEFDI